MTEWIWEIKIFDTSASKFISGLEQDVIGPISVSRAVSETVGEFSFDFDTPDCTIGPEDVVILNIGQLGSTLIKWFIGKVEKAVELGEPVDRYYSITGREIAKLLLTTDAPKKDYVSTQQHLIIKETLSSLLLDFNSSLEWVSNEPVFVVQQDQWQDLIVPELKSGSWTVTYNGTTMTYGQDYDIDLSTDPPRGRIRVYSSGAIKRGGYAYAGYQTYRALPIGREYDNVKKYELTVSSVVTENEALNYNATGQVMWDVVSAAAVETSIDYDFWLDEHLDFHTQGRNSGIVHTYPFDDISDLEVYEDSSFIINKTQVLNKALQLGETWYFPDPIDSFTEFDNSPSTEYWSTGATSLGVFDCGVKFSNSSAEAVGYGGRFTDDYEIQPGLSTHIAGMVGTNYLGAHCTTPVRVMKVWRVFDPPIADLGDVNLYGNMRFFEYGDPAYPEVGCRVEHLTTQEDKFYRGLNLTSGAFLPDLTVINAFGGSIGNPSWTSINEMAWKIYSDNSTAMHLYLDGLYYGTAPIVGEAEDIPSQQAYGVIKTNGLIPYPVVDNTITTWIQAQQRANSIIARFRDPIGVVEKVYFEDGNLEVKPGDKLRIETQISGTYYPTTRVVSVFQEIDGNDIFSTIECRVGSPSGIESYMEELESEIRRLEMRVQ